MKIQFDPFIVEYDVIDSPILSFKEECINAARNAISENTNNLPILVLMSGGIDSELVAESLLLAGIFFECLIVKLKIDLLGESVIFNSHDYQYAEQWCRKNSVDIVYVELDIFKNSNLLCEYVSSAKGFSPQFACHMYFMKWCNDNGYFFITGNGETDIVRKNDEYFVKDEQRDYTLNNFCQLHNLSGIPQFWKTTRLTAAVLRLPTVVNLMDQKIDSLLQYKNKYFRDSFQSVVRDKKTGFEEIQEWDYHLRTFMKRQNGIFDSKFYTPITYFWRI